MTDDTHPQPRPSREEIIDQARIEHDRVCNCDAKYVMSCPRMTAAILGRMTTGSSPTPEPGS